MAVLVIEDSENTCAVSPPQHLHIDIGEVFHRNGLGLAFEALEHQAREAHGHCAPHTGELEIERGPAVQQQDVVGLHGKQLCECSGADVLGANVSTAVLQGFSDIAASLCTCVLLRLFLHLLLLIRFIPVLVHCIDWHGIVVQVLKVDCSGICWDPQLL